MAMLGAQDVRLDFHTHTHTHTHTHLQSSVTMAMLGAQDVHLDFHTHTHTHTHTPPELCDSGDAGTERGLRSLQQGVQYDEGACQQRHAAADSVEHEGPGHRLVLNLPAVLAEHYHTRRGHHTCNRQRLADNASRRQGTAVLQHTVCSQTEHRLATNYSGVMYSQPEHHHSTHSVFIDRAPSGNKLQRGDVFTARTPPFNTQCVHRQSAVWQQTTVGVMCSQPEHHHSTHSVFTDRAPSGNKPQYYSQNTTIQHTVCSQTEHHHTTHSVFTTRTPSFNTQCVHNQNTILQHTMCSQAEHHPTTHSVFTTRTPPCNTQCVHNQNTILQHTMCSQPEHHPATHSMFTGRTPSYNTQCVHNQNTILQHTVCSQPEHYPTTHNVFTTRTLSYNTQCVHNLNSVLQDVDR